MEFRKNLQELKSQIDYLGSLKKEDVTHIIKSSIYEIENLKFFNVRMYFTHTCEDARTDEHHYGTCTRAPLRELLDELVLSFTRITKHANTYTTR